MNSSVITASEFAIMNTLVLEGLQEATSSPTFRVRWSPGCSPPCRASREWLPAARRFACTIWPLHRGPQRPRTPGLLLLGLAAAGVASAQQASNEELALQLANPVAALISVPFQLNYDRNVGPEENGDRWTLNVQPVVPLSLNEDWNLISRTILPLVHQSDIFPGAGSQSGTGDIVQSLFFSPVQPVNGWILGAGPVFLLPTGSDDLLTTDKWGAGPTGVALRQSGPWTYGALVNHIWSFAGSGERPDVNATFLQPFVSYTTPAGMTMTLQTESTYDWESERWTVPVAGVVSKVIAIGDQRMSVGGGLRYYVDSPASGPEGLAFRVFASLLFPR